VTIASAVLALVGLVIEICGLVWIIAVAIATSRRLREDIRLIEWTTYESVKRQRSGEDSKVVEAWRAAELAKRSITPDTMLGHEPYTLRRVLAAMASGEAGSFVGGGALILLGTLVQGAGGVAQLVAAL
jgi:hypothetical protein